MNEPEYNLDYYRAQMEALMEHAKGHGISGVAILHDADPISQGAAVRTVMKGEPYLLRGLIDTLYRGD